MTFPQIDSAPPGAKGEPRSRRELVLPPCAPLMAIHADHLNRPRAPRGSLFDDLFGTSKPQGFTRAGATAVVAIEGPIDQRGSWFYEGYDAIQQRFAAALGDAQTTGVLIQMNSPGGVCAGCFEAVRALAAMKAASGKPVFVYADEMAYSAAYALATIADEIWLPPEGGVGSVGVIATYVDLSKMYEEMGVRFAVVTSGNEKADGHPAVPLTDAAIGRLREDVMDLAKGFWGVVAAARGITVEQVKALQAGTYMGAKAVDVKIADHVGSMAEALGALEARSAATKPKTSARAEKDKRMTTKTGADEPMIEAASLIETIPAAEHRAVISAMKTSSDATVAALQSKIGEQKAALDQANARIAKLDGEVAVFEAARIEAKVEAFVGHKFTEAGKAPWLALAKSNEASFDAIVPTLPDLGLLGPPIVKGGDGVGERGADAAAADRKTTRYLALVDEKVKAGVPRNDALGQVLIDNPDLLES